jgi:predicted alpha-1,2-mannosidase
MRRSFALVAGLLLVACSESAPPSDAGVRDAGADAQVDAFVPPSRPATPPLIDYVDPFLGTGGLGFNDIGSAFPGPQRPFGLVRPGPDTADESGAPQFTHCSGFAFNDEYVTGLSHTRMHGTGIVDYGAVALMPIDTMQAAYTDQVGYRTKFTPGSREASPGYFAMTLERGDVRVELTSTDRVAVHRYRYAAGQPQAVLVDVGHRLAEGVEIVDGAVEIDVEAREVRGFSHFSGGYSNRFGGMPVYFVARFDRPFASHGVWRGETLEAGGTTATGARAGAWLDFAPSEGDTVHAEVAISFVDLDGARRNLEAESTGFDFDRVRADSEAIWEEILSRVRIEGRTETDFRRFYTALYHSLLMPTLAMDVDGRYRGLDAQVHVAEGYRYYTDFSLWDTFRTLHPLLTLLYPDIQTDMLRSLVAMSRDGGAMPRWPLGIGYTGGMLGDPAAIVLADSWAKGLRDFDLRTGYDALARSAVGVASPRFAGRGSAEVYDRLGYVPIESGGSSTSKTLEFAYADWALAILADALGETEDAARWRVRAGNFRNAYDPARGFFVGRYEDGRFVETLDEAMWQPFYAEGNAWQYLWYAPDDLAGLAELMGGREALLERLRFFFAESRAEERWLPPPRWYWHGNEPDIHAAFVFTELGEPAEGAVTSRWIARTMYGDGPTGLPGNDDGGTLSAWLVFASMGLFPIAGRDDYLIGSPLLTRVELTLGEGTFVIEAPESSEQAPYVGEARLDGVVLEGPRVPHASLRPGGRLSLDMRETP